MQLFVDCPVCKARHRCNFTGKQRAEIPFAVTLTCNNQACGYRGVQQSLTAHSVYAVPDALATAGGTLGLGVLGGLVAGPPGLAIGLVLGFLGGKKVSSVDYDAAKRFNQSQVVGFY